MKFYETNNKNLRSLSSITTSVMRKSIIAFGFEVESLPRNCSSPSKLESSTIATGISSLVSPGMKVYSVVALV